jgi:cytochrome c biogenesis protein ResB
LKTSAVIIAALSLGLLLSVLLPQETVDPGGYATAVRGGPAARFVLETLGLGRFSTSPVFFVLLGAFFANLGAVLVDRVGITLRRIRVGTPSGAQVGAMLAGTEASRLPEAIPDAEARASEILSDLGFSVRPVGRGTIWGVKHRLAPLGFPLFHAAFFVLAVGSLGLYLTRDVVEVIAAEGQAVSSRGGAVGRRAPLGAPPEVTVEVRRVDVALEEGRPTDLAATVALAGAPGDARLARINHPAVWGDLTVLVGRAGIAPVLWLVDERGFTLDRVAVLAVVRGELPTRVTVGGDVEAIVAPIPVSASFPERRALPTVPISLRLRVGEGEVFDGTLRSGEGVEVGGRTLRLQEVRYWAGLTLVRERGGGLLVAGFLMSVLGIVWRMVWHRREIVVSFEDGMMRVGGRSEFYPARFRNELEQTRALMLVRLGPVREE